MSQEPADHSGVEMCWEIGTPLKAEGWMAVSACERSHPSPTQEAGSGIKYPLGSSGATLQSLVATS